jgi:hypothetical protein
MRPPRLDAVGPLIICLLCTTCNPAMRSPRPGRRTRPHRFVLELQREKIVWGIEVEPSAQIDTPHPHIAVSAAASALPARREAARADRSRTVRTPDARPRVAVRPDALRPRVLPQTPFVETMTPANRPPGDDARDPPRRNLARGPLRSDDHRFSMPVA